MPYFFASLKVAITVAFVGSIVAETVGSNKGIGNFMLVASSRSEVPLAFAGLLVTGVMGILMYAVSEHHRAPHDRLGHTRRRQRHVRAGGLTSDAAGCPRPA